MKNPLLPGGVSRLFSSIKGVGLVSHAFGVLGLLCSAISARAATASFASPALDKWMYPNVPAATSGSTGVAPIFSFLNTTDEDRMGGMLVGFNTSTLVPAGLAASSYAVTSIKLTIAIATDDTFLYDPTHDSYRSSLLPGDPNYLADTDVGKPIEVFGVGLRNGYNKLSATISGSTTLYSENSPVGTTGATNFRNAYPIGKSTGGSLFDVTDNVSLGQDALPFAVGTTTDVSVGGSVPAGAIFTFSLTLTDADILAYVQNGLSDGILGLYLSTLSTAEGQDGPQTYPRIFTKEGAPGAAYIPQLQITYSIIPEPSPALGLILGLGVLTAGRAFHRRRHFL